MALLLTKDQALAATNKLYRRLEHRRPGVRTANHYYRGRQPLRFASEKWREYVHGRYAEFSDNWCAPVANSPNERLRIDGFRLGDDPQQSDVEKALWQDWLAANMEMQSSQGLLASIIAKRSFVLVWGDKDDKPLVTWERPDQAIVDYDPEHPQQRRQALKAWTEDDIEYATLYTPDEVWKWERKRVQEHRVEGPLPPVAQEFFYSTSGLAVPASNDSGWLKRQPPEDDAWPLTNPLGEVPMVEFPNRPMLDDGEPLSDIEGTMAMQDAINLLWAYLFNAADFASMPARVVMGQEPPKIPILNEQGQKVGEQAVDLKKLAEDRILWLTGQNTKIGQWAPAQLDVFTKVVETAVSHVAAQTRTPPHYLILGQGMVNISADGMRAAETGLLMKVGEEQLFFNPPTRETFRLMALVRDKRDVADQCRRGTPKWKDAENRSEAQTVDALQKLQAIGFPFEWLAERYGLTAPEIQRVLAMKQRETDQDVAFFKFNPAADQGGQRVPADLNA